MSLVIGSYRCRTRYILQPIFNGQCLQEVFVGGEALPLSTCRSWLKKWPHVAWAKLSQTLLGPLRGGRSELLQMMGSGEIGCELCNH